MPDRNARPRAPGGSDNEARRFIDTHEILHPARRPMPAPLQRAVAVAAGIRYAVPIEIVSGRAYSKGERVHVQPDHLLVTTGIRDRAVPTGPLVQSRAGWYIAMQDVPAKSTVSGNDVWDLPQFPYPVPKNLDDKKNFWEWMPDNYC